MHKHLAKIISALSLVVLLSGIASPAVFAATTTTSGTGQALEIAPPLIYLNVSPGQTVSTQVLIRDVSDTELVVTGQVNDFIASGEDGTPKVILNNDTSDPFSLKSWVVPPASLDLVPKQIKTLNVTINVPADASPGGHYGVIRFTGNAPTLNGSSGVSLSASLGALMLLTVSGKITDSLTVQQFSVTHNGKAGTLFQSGPLGFAEVLKNTGNVHEQPVGSVTITDMFGKKLATLTVNTPPGNVLPASARKFSESLDKSVIGNKRLFGHYTAKLSVTYGSSKKVLTSSLGFWVIPFKLVGAVIAILVAAFFGLRYALRRYNRRVLEQAQKRPPAAPPAPPKQ
jgi:hypothetical protein